MIKVTLLGTGTSHGVPVLGCHCPTCLSMDSRDSRYRSSAYVEADDCRILIDTATELRLQALRQGLTCIDAVLLTHHHADHICGFDDLRRFNEMQKAEIPAYGSRETLEYVQQMYGYIFNHRVEPGGGKPLIGLHPVEREFAIGNLKIIPIPVLHGWLEVFGYRIGNFAYVTDCKQISQSSLKLLMGLELLVLGVLRFRPHETHLNLEESLELLRILKPKRTIFTHISHDFKHSDSVNWLPSGVELGYDGMQIEVR